MPVPFTPWWLAGGISKSACVAAYQPLGAKSLVESYVNLANPGMYNAAPGVAPAWDAVNGWTFNGSNQYLTTGIVPASTWSAIVRYSDSNKNHLFGCYQESLNGGFSINLRPDLAYYQYINAGQNYVGAVPPASGVIGFAGKACYKNGVADGTIGVGMTTFSIPIYIGCRNYEGFGVNAHIATKIQAFAIYNTNISAAMAAVTLAIQKQIDSDQYRLAQMMNQRHSWKVPAAGTPAAFGTSTLIKHSGRNRPL